MQYRSVIKQAFKSLLVASLLGFGFTMAQTEPTLNQVYATAQAGKLEQAQLMIQQVLIAHPNSAKAFFVRSELYSRQGDLLRAREALATAEKLAPGLPFAKADAVQALRAQLAEKKFAPVVSGQTTHANVTAHNAQPTAATPALSTSSWLIPMLLTGGAIAAGYFLFRKKKPDPFSQQAGFTNQNAMTAPQTYGFANAPYGQPAYANQDGISGPQTFGTGNSGAMQQPYGQPGGSGLGGRIMGGVATGLAVGAGVMAAQAIGRNLMGEHSTTPSAGAPESLTNSDFQAVSRNADMGGQGFGISDTSSWDDGSSVDAGGDWDN